ncbi:MAG TPA: hypothetical protein VLH79_06230 [Chthonomonadales bacterium]|nr:hypothetical protein [Chthonomonadales bacterium]
MMDKRTQQRIVREQRAAYARYEQRLIEEARRATFEDRVRDLENIMGLARALRLPEPDWTDDEQVTERWLWIRERYAAKRLDEARAAAIRDRNEALAGVGLAGVLIGGVASRPPPAPAHRRCVAPRGVC